ncbi:MAG: hypothetical protein E6G13_14550 [Actinobacteria bacterium]|nr:MAG: hypothetical protein E6G13_14550 [Actinomycetota bacterium]
MIRVDLDVTPLLQTRAGTARYILGLRRELAMRTDVSSERPVTPPPTFCTARRTAVRSAAACPSSSLSMTLPSSASRAPSTAGRATTGRSSYPM